MSSFAFSVYMSRLQPLLLPDSLHKYTSPRNTRMCGYRLDSHVDSNVCIVELLEKICTCIRAWISMDCHADVLCSEEGHAHLCMCIASHFTHIHFLKHEQIFCICILLHTYSFNALCMYTHTHRTGGCVALKVIHMEIAMRVYSEYCSRCVHADML